MTTAHKFPPLGVEIVDVGQDGRAVGWATAHMLVGVLNGLGRGAVHPHMHGFMLARRGRRGEVALAGGFVVPGGRRKVAGGGRGR